MAKFDNEYNAVRSRIFSRLKDLGVSQKDFAKTLGLAPQTVTDWKNGKSNSFVSMAAKIAPVLNTTITWILTGAGEINAENNQHDEVQLERQRLEELRTRHIGSLNEGFAELSKSLEHVLDLIDAANSAPNETQSSPPQKRDRLPDVWYRLTDEQKTRAEEFMRSLQASGTDTD